MSGPLHAAATDEQGDVRAVELDRHPFFVAALFQPERGALRGRTPPLVVAFAAACVTAQERMSNSVRTAVRPGSSAAG